MSAKPQTVFEESKMEKNGTQHANQQPDTIARNLVENPLAHLSQAEIVTQANDWCQENNLAEHTDLFGRAALVARDPRNFESLTELKDDEREALIYERDHKWRQTKWLWYSMTLCAVGAATQGWDQTGSNAANLSFPVDFHIDSTTGSDPWKVGAINAVIFLSAGGIGVWLSDPLNRAFGRRGEIFIAGVVLLLTPIGSGLAQSWQGLFAARFILGLGLGAKNATVPVYSSEMAPARIRGALVMFWQLWVTFGIFIGYAANLIVKDTGNISWRLQLGSAFIPCVPLVLGIWFCPESPRWLMRRGNFPKAFRSFLKLRMHPIIAARDLYYSNILYERELQMAGGRTYFARLTDLFTVPRIRRGTWAAFMVMIAQQMCGINIIGFYSSTIFVKGGFSQDQALYASFGFGALNFTFAIPALFMIDSFGRRSLLLLTFPLMCIFLLAAGLSFLMPHVTESQLHTRTGVVALFVYIFTIFYSFGEGPVAFQYSAEVFPTIHRDMGMAWACCINFIFAGVLSITLPTMLDRMGSIGVFGFYAGLNLLAWFGIFCLCPETKQYTLEELDQVFEIPRAEFLRYQTQQWLPYFVRRYLLFRRNVKAPAPLISRDG